MDRTLRIGVVGDYRPGKETHVATEAAIAHAACVEGCASDVTWLPTSGLAVGRSGSLMKFDALLVAPGSPYQSMEGALEAIRVARTEDIPLLGTCGGFQHIVIEFARNVLGIADAQHAEYHPAASSLFIDALACSLAGRAMVVAIRPATTAAAAYRSSRTTEQYYCRFGLNPECRRQLEEGGLVVSGTDQDDEVRIIELPGRSFFVGTLFVPQVSSRPSAPHPLLSAFVRAACARASGAASTAPTGSVENLQVREATVRDLPFLWECLAIASQESTVEAASAVPGVAKYLTGWLRPGDFGVLAEDGEQAVGAAWARQFHRQEEPWVYVDANIPEIAIAVVSDYRGCGVGSLLLQHLIATAKKRQCDGLCLNVRDDSRAVELYERLGFACLPGSEVANRVGGSSFGMALLF